MSTTLPTLISSLGLSVLIIALVLLVWSVARKMLSSWGIGLLFLGVLVQIAAAILDELPSEILPNVQQIPQIFQ
jgi:hypothetical protein